MVEVVGIIQARYGSQRLKGKVLAPLIESESVLSALIKRIAKSNIEWWVATTVNSEDDLIEAWATHLGVKVFRGSENDVLSRFTSIARIVKPNWIVRVTADDPFMSYKEVKTLISMISSAKDSTSLICDNPIDRVFPLGYCPELARVEALFYAEKSIPSSESFHRTHVTSFLRPHAEYVQLDNQFRHPEYRWTIDTREDLIFAQSIFEKLKTNYISADYFDFLEVCRSNPELLRLNSAIQQKKLEDG